MFSHEVPLPWSLLQKGLWFPVQLAWSMPSMVGLTSEIFSHFYYELAIAMFSYKVPPLPWSLLQKVLWFPVLQWCHLLQVKQQQELHYYRRNLTFIWWWDATTQLLFGNIMPITKTFVSQMLTVQWCHFDTCTMVTRSTWLHKESYIHEMPFHICSWE